MEEHARRWSGSMAEAYDRGLVPTIFGPFATDLAGRIAALTPHRILEVAAGTGVLTAEIGHRLPDAEVVATDLNDAMVAVGAERAPAATWRQADAADLPFADDEFDVVACQFGAMFFPGPAAFSEIRRVLAPTGTFVLNVWGAVADHEFDTVIVPACAALFPDDPPTFLAIVPRRYQHADDLLADLRAAGFDPTLDTIDLVGTAAT